MGAPTSVTPGDTIATNAQTVSENNARDDEIHNAIVRNEAFGGQRVFEVAPSNVANRSRRVAITVLIILANLMQVRQTATAHLWSHDSIDKEVRRWSRTASVLLGAWQSAKA
jgi:hypothetical protein